MTANTGPVTHVDYLSSDSSGPAKSPRPEAPRRVAPSPPGSAAVDPVAIALMGELAAGRSIAHAAATCEVSYAAARRSLSALRSEWGLEHDIQLIVSAVRRGLI